MSQVSVKLRRASGAYTHWCPACEEMHQLPDSWNFDGNLEFPTFTPSFKHRGMQTVKVNGKWNGEWVLDAAGNPIPRVCHYILTAGVLNFCADCTHSMAGEKKLLPDLPGDLVD